MVNCIKKQAKLLPNILLKLIVSFLFVKLASVFSLSFVVGSFYTFFSGKTIAMPMIGHFAGGPVAFLLCIVKMMSCSVIFGLRSLHMLAFFLPGLFSAFYFSYNNIVTRLFVPIVCMVLFLMHPVGRIAFGYSLFWMIPICLYFIRSKHMVLDALASSFIAHAVGSVIWIYTVPMKISHWYALIPQVLLERISVACGIFLVYWVVHFIQNKVAYFWHRYKIPVRINFLLARLTRTQV